MDKTIDISVKGSYLRKNNNAAGVQGEGNATVLHITFDSSWEGLAKTITFWDSRGENPTKVILTNALLVDMENSLLEYNCPIPSEPLAYEGKLTFIIDGYVDGKRQRSMQDTLIVDAALISDDAEEAVDPTPTQAEQLQSAIEKILPNVAEEVEKAQTAANTATTAVNNAETYVTLAMESATNAETYATSASTSANEASESAVSASNSATTAQEAQTATETAKSVVETDKEAVETVKNDALTIKSDVIAIKNVALTAQKAAETAQSKAETAQSKAETAQNNAQTAQTAAETAQAKAETAKTSAQGSATTASDNATTAHTWAQTAENQAIMSQSYAIGGTGMRDNENADNAKYYCEKASAIVGGDFVTTVQLETFKTENVDPIEEKANSNETALATLNGTGAGSVKKQIDDAFNEFATNISDDGVVNTYKELVDYCAAHAPEVAKMASDIDTNTTNIATNASAISDLQSNKVGSVNSKTGTAITLTASDVGAVANTGDETIDGVKTFSSGIQIPLIPSANANATSKQYVDNAISTAIATAISTALNTGV